MVDPFAAGSAREVRTRRHKALLGPLVAVFAGLSLNVMPFGLAPSALPLPRTVGQLISQGSLVFALLLALAANSRIILRHTLFLVLYSTLAVVTLMASMHNQFLIGSTYRALRLVAFLVVLWLLTPWWGRRDMLLLRIHLLCMWVAIGSVLVGAIIAPGPAFALEGRLTGVLWPIHTTQVAHYAAVLFGISLILWTCRVTSGRSTLLALAVSGTTLVLTHTRTAVAASLAGLVVAGASLFLTHARVRRVSTLAAMAGVLAATFFASGVQDWLMRGQTAQQASQLTGRTLVWSAVMATVRPKIDELFGSGLSDQSFNGRSIDNNWLATYVDQGWFGVVVQIAAVLLLLLMAAAHERGPQRAAALFLVVYCIVSSFTAVVISTPTPYLLDLAVAASLLVPEVRVRPRVRAPSRSDDNGDPPTDGTPVAPRTPSLPAHLPRSAVNINTANDEELMGLPGVGRTTATAILRWRAANGPFRQVSQLLEVSGIGQSLLVKIVPFVTLEEWS